MPLCSIWERYFLREITKVFLLFLVGFYGLYAILDYSTHSSSFQHYRFTFIEVILFYLYEFVGQMNVLVPFAMLIACVKTLCTLNTRNELVALLVGGIKLKRLMLPFIFFGLICTAMLYVNTEYLHPKSLKFHKLFSETRAKEKQKKNHHPHIQQVALEDNSSFIFQEYQANAERFFDAYWIRSIDDIYRIKYLIPNLETPKGIQVEHYKRDKSGALVVIESAEEMELPQLHFNKKSLLDTVTSPDELAISTLKAKLPQEDKVLSEKDAKLLTTYYYKLAMPWLCLLAVIAPIPFCTRFTRSLPVFFIYAFSLFGIVATFIVMDAAVILGERQVIPPLAAIWIPIIALFVFFGWKFAKT